jgi:DNA-binding NtrC family response regulator
MFQLGGRSGRLLPVASALGPEHLPLSTSLAEALVLYDWPLNVRELVQLATHLKYCAAELSDLDLPHVAGRLGPLKKVDPAAEAQSISDDAVSDAEEDSAFGAPPPKPLPREEVERLLKEHHGIIARVAAAAGRSPRQVRRWIAQYNIDLKRLG